MSFFSKLFHRKAKQSNFSEADPYRDLIIDKFVDAYECRIELIKLGPKDYEQIFPVDSSGDRAIKYEDIENKIGEINRYILQYVSEPSNKIFWFQVNVIDQAINDYIGPENFESVDAWLPTILDRLNNYRADQSGDTIVIIFSSRIEWAVSFCLCQDNSTLSVERFIANEQHQT